MNIVEKINSGEHNNKLFRIDKYPLQEVEKVMSQYGSFEEYLRQEHPEKESVSVQIYMRNGSRKNGNLNGTPIGTPVQLKLNPANTSANTSANNPTHLPTQPTPNPTQPFFSPSIPLNGAMDITGIMDLNTRAFDRERLLSENQRLKTENEQLRKENFNQKEEILQLKYETKGKEGNGELLKGLLEMGKAFLEGKSQGEPSALAPLNAPATDSQSTEIITAIKDQYTRALLYDVLYLCYNNQVGRDFYDNILNLINQTKEQLKNENNH